MSGSSSAPVLTSFTSGDIVISVVGDGDGSGTYTDNQAAPIVLEEIDPTTGAEIGQMTLPLTSSTNATTGVVENPISGEYGSSSEGSLELAANGQSLVIAGYGVNDVTYNTGGAAVYGNAAEAQSTSIQGGKYTAVPRVIADISFNGTVDTSTALYNIFDGNNPRSVATVDGSSFYIAGQGQKGDTTQGLFYAQDGANAATAIDTSTDARTVEIYQGLLYLSRDSTQGSGGTSNISTYGALPTSATVPTTLPDLDGSVTLTAAQANSLNAGAVGTKVDLSPENFFFANATTLYVADGGNPKEGTIGDGGLQKWILNTQTNTWTLAYTLSDGLNLVENGSVSGDTAGSTGLIGLTGVVNDDGTVTLYATNSTIGDLDQTYLYKITDILNATTAPAGESFSILETAAPDTNIRGVALAPTAPTSGPTNTVIAAGSATAAGFTLTSGSTLTIQNGGTAAAVRIISGGVATVSGTDNNSYIGEGGTETLFGSATGDQIYGTQIVSSSPTGAIGSVSNETIFNGGALDLFIKGATAAGTNIESGGRMVISGNATATNTLIDGGMIIIESPKAVLAGGVTFAGAGTLEELAISSATYGDLAVISGFTTGDTIDLTQIIESGASLTSSVVGGNTVETVTSGAVVQTFTFAGTYAAGHFDLSADPNGGTELVVASSSSSGGGGSTNTTTISAGQTTPPNYVVAGGQVLDVLNGGSAAGITVDANGLAIIEVGGTDSASTIAAGGNETILGSANADQIFGTQLVSAATAIVGNETVFNGGAIDLFLKGAIASNTTLHQGGSLLISGNATALNTVIDGGTIVLESPKAVLSGTLSFTSNGGEIQVTSLTNTTSGVPFGDQAAIAGFFPGDIIDVTVINSAGAMLTSSVVSGNTVETITNGGSSESFIFSGTNYGANYFSLAPDGGSGVELVATACFAAGTNILTAQGEVAVERLAVGDEILLAAGATAPVTWIGRRTLAPRRHTRPEQVQPILIHAGALADGVPCRDLILSPDHALYLNGHLIPAKTLLNDLTIRQLDVAAITYFHIELPAHAILLAEGAAAESYLETGNRGAFENAGQALTLHPDFAQTRREQTGCAPFATHGPAVEAARAAILARAPRRLTDDPATTIRRRGDAIIIESRSAVPARLSADPRDQRRLGLKIAALTAGGRPIPLDHPALTEGWHAPEPDGRWTNGRAVIPAALLGGQSLVVTLEATTRYEAA